MKKSLLVLFILLGSLFCSAQFGSNPTSGNGNWNSHFLGAVTGDRGIVAGTFIDTATCNAFGAPANIKGVPFIIINTTSDGASWIRNSSATGWNKIGVGSGVGTVTSVALSLPSIFTVSGSPVTTSGTLTGTLNTQSANRVFAGPTSGGAATPTFRALVAADIAGLSTNIYNTDGTLTGNRLLSTSTNSFTINYGVHSNMAFDPTNRTYSVHTGTNSDMGIDIDGTDQDNVITKLTGHRITLQPIDSLNILNLPTASSTAGYDVALWDKISGQVKHIAPSSIVTATPTLAAVTAVGNSTTSNIGLFSSANLLFSGNSSPGGYLEWAHYTDAGTGRLRDTATFGTNNWYLPAASGTIALTSNIPSTPTLAQVTAVGATTAVNTIFSTSMQSPIHYGGSSANSTLTLTATSAGIPGSSEAVNINTNGTNRVKVTHLGNVGISNTTPDSTFSVNGGLQFVTGRQGAGKVLTSDASGGADWQTPSAGTPSLTYTRIAIGDVNNLMTSSVNFTFDDPTLKIGVVSSNLSLQVGNGYFATGDIEGNISNGNKFIVDDGSDWAFFDNTAHTGKFGINTSTPSVALDVVGDVNVKGGSYNSLFHTTLTDGTWNIGDAAGDVGTPYISGLASTIELYASSGYTLSGSGATTIASISGTGTRMVTADATGILGTGGIVTSGTYTPTLTNTTNVTSSTPIVCHYTRVGNEVTVTGSVGVVTTLAVATVLGISLPVASNFAATTDAAGVGNASSAIGTNGYIQGNTTTDISELRFIGLSVGGSGTIFFTFTYTII